MPSLKKGLIWIRNLFLPLAALTVATAWKSSGFCFFFFFPLQFDSLNARTQYTWNYYFRNDTRYVLWRLSLRISKHFVHIQLTYRHPWGPSGSGAFRPNCPEILASTGWSLHQNTTCNTPLMVSYYSMVKNRGQKGKFRIDIMKFLLSSPYQRVILVVLTAYWNFQRTTILKVAV